MKSPFQAATPVAKKLKICFFGPSGSGKTLAALSFPRVALIDAEGGSDLYAGRPGIAAFSVLRSKSIPDLREAISYIRADGGKTFDTLVIDPITVFYDVQKEATARAAKGGDMGFREWSRVNGAMKGIYTELYNLPVHVVVVSREATEYETVNGELRKTGMKADADKALPYTFDFVLRFSPDHSATVIKSRGAEMGEGQRIKTVNWHAFAAMAAAYSSGQQVQLGSDEAAAEALATAEEFEDRNLVESFFAHWKAQGLTVQAVLNALSVTRASEWKRGLAAAHEAVRMATMSIITPPAAAPAPTPAATITITAEPAPAAAFTQADAAVLEKWAAEKYSLYRPDIHRALGISRYGLYTGTLADAKAAVVAWLDAQFEGAVDAPAVEDAPAPAPAETAPVSAAR